jgi:EmrB/QacA subfamily drug resistance transporter
MFLIAISIFLFGSLLSGMAGSMWELAAFRAVQGLGAGGLFSLAITVLADIVPPRERARYQGMFLAVFGTSSVLGPVVGGLFASTHQILWIDGWRWVFLINMPVGIAALFMVVKFLHVPHTPKKHRIDWLGAVTIALAVVPLLVVAENGNDWGWSSGNSIAMYVTGAVGIIAFIFAERAAKHEALIPLTLFRSRTFSLASILSVIVGVGMFGGMMTLPLILQIVNGATPTQSGFMTLPMVGGLMVASIISGQVTRRTGKYSMFLPIGLGLLLTGYFYMTSYTADMQYWQISIGMIMIGFGLGLLMQTLNLVSQQSVSASEVGVATSSAAFFRQMGGSLGVAVFISILFNSLGDHIGNAFKNKAILAGVQTAAQDPKVLADPNNASLLKAMSEGAGGGLSGQLKTDSSFLTKLDPRLARPFLVGFADSAAEVFFWAGVVVSLAFIISWFVKAPALRDTSASAEAAAQAIVH